MPDVPAIPGLNVPLALRQLGNNMKLFSKLLDQFQKSYCEAGREVASAVASGDYETAERSAHTIKGLAGSLGAAALQEKAACVEKLCRERVSGQEIQDAIASFDQETRSQVAAIRTYLQSQAEPAAAAPAPGVNQPQLAAQLAALAAHIDDSDARALMLFDTLRPGLDAFDRVAAQKIADAFDVFDFFAAGEIVQALRTRLQ